MSKIVKPLTAVLGAALLASVSLSASAASANPFAADEMDSGYMQLVQDDEEGSCGDKDEGEGSCGDKDEGEGSCGDKDEGEGSCGDKDEAEGSCGG